MSKNQTFSSPQDFSKITSSLVRNSGHRNFRPYRKSLEIQKVAPLLVTENPIIAFDSHVIDDDTNAPIELGIRQPKFTLLSDHQLIPKGSDSMADFTPVLDEVEHLPDASPEEEDSDPNVQLVQELNKKNASRWSLLGYEPPSNIIPLVRAASQSIFQPQEFNQIDRKQLSNTLPSVIEESETQNDPIKLEKKHTINRSGSFGMLPGQAQTEISDQMKKILPSTIPEYIEEEEIFEEEQIDEEETVQDENENLQYSSDELFGRLNEIVTEPKDSLEYQILKTGEIPMEACNEFKNLVKVFEHYRDFCQNNDWEDEMGLLDDIINIMNSEIINGNEEENDIEIEEEEEENYQEGPDICIQTETKLGNFFETGKLTVHPPKMLNRSFDFLSIQGH